ncbi:hypothetical protein CPT_Munch_171 [Salmonella phage Munch]|nr:hypothetical protein CPT_Munch_171 [Salmonella phage Munch]
MSSKRVIGNVEILGNLTINGKYAMRTFNHTNPDPNTGIITYPFYTRGEVQDILDMLPISRIGEMDYLPINISGSFSGATSYANVKRIQPTILEDDGTFVILRPGTNGSQFNFYYAYVRNIRNIENLSQSDIVQTNTIYKPSYMSSTQKIEQFYGTNGYELLWYKLSNTAGSDSYSITLTNGSFNEVGHQSVLIPTSSFPNYAPSYAHVVNGIVYMWGYDTSLGQGRALVLYTIPVDSIRAGNTNGFVKVTGFNGSSIRGEVYTNSDTALIYTKFQSRNDTGDNLFAIMSNLITGVDYHEYAITNALAFVNPEGNKIRFAMFPTYRYGTNYNFSDVRTYCISMVYDISTKTFTYDTPLRSPISIDAEMQNSSSVRFIENNPYKVQSVVWRGFNETLGNCGTICQANDGFMVATRSRWPSDASFGISSSKINLFTNQFDSINMTNRAISFNTQLRANPTYGSAVGENLIGPRFISKSRIILACSGTYDGVTYPSYDTVAIADVGTDTNFTYESLTRGTLQGYAPQSYRKILANPGSKFNGLVTLVDESGNVASHSTSFWGSGAGKDAGLNINPDTLEYDGNTVSVGDGVMGALRDAIIAKAAIPTDASATIGLYYVPEQSFSKSFGVVMIRYPDNTGKFVVAEVDVTTSTSNNHITITGASVYSTRVWNRQNISSVGYVNLDRYPGIYVGKYNGFNYVSVHSVAQFGIPGDARTYTMIGKIKNGVIQSNFFNESYYLDTYGLVGGVLPGIGFGYYDNGKANDYQTKSVFQLYGTTEAQMDAMIARTGTPIREVVVISQEVPEGFDVYFTQELPVFLGGLYYKLPIQTMNLRSIKDNPANSTFYIYITMDRSEKKASYVISESLLDETLTRVYIGRIITGNVGIDTIESEKVTRFLTYRPSTTKRGSAIPASTGVPSGTGARWK